MPWSCSACTFLNADEMKICEMCSTKRAITCKKCNQSIQGGQILAAGETYHRECFTCAACHHGFETNQFQVHEGDAYHTDCYRTLFLPRCDVCDNHLPIKEGGKVVFRHIPFWDMRYCIEHEDRDRCCSCQRVESTNPRKAFEVLSDGRKTCHDCCLSVVLDTDEAQPVIAEVWQFMKSIGITLPSIPVYLVEYAMLNEHQHASHGYTDPNCNGFVTRGLCLSEVTTIHHLARRGRNHVSEAIQLQTNRSVNAILILHGLPYDLTAQVLAHESTHAYIKLHDGFPIHIDPIVEEGMCQLISYLWLQYKQMMESSDAPFRSKLRQYYIFQIEHDSSVIYGDGFRAALAAYERTHSLQALFDSIRQTGCFP